MTSSKRDFTDFESFPGELDEGTGYHTLPTLWHKDESEHWRQWTINIRMIKKSNPLTGIDWNVLDETQVPINLEYYSVGSTIPASIVAEAWVESGVTDGKITRFSPTYFDTISNGGRSNERNVFQQALIYARSQWLKRKEKGGNEKQLDTKVNKVNTMYFPMLAKTFKDAAKHLVFPFYIQPKLDGVRCLAYLSKKNGGVSNVVIYTRTKKLFPSVDYLKKILYPMLNSLYDVQNNQSIYLDGELYKHGKKLQDISGDSRNESADVSDDNIDRNEYHIYDCFYPKELSTKFADRYKQLVALYDSLDADDEKIIKRVPTILVKSLAAADKKYTLFKSMGYEGAILRNTAGPYLANANKTGSLLRSNDLVKMKPKFTDEFVVTGYSEGSRGKDKGAIIWVCETKNKIEFNVTPKGITYEERYKLFTDAEKNFDSKYAHRMLTVEYEDLSNDGVPLRAKAVSFRDYE